MELLKAFFKDHIPDMIGYLGLTVLIIFYYYLEFGNSIPVIYPVILMLFVVSVIFLVKGYRYYRFHKVLKAALYSEYHLHHVTCQEKFALETIHKLHQKHHTELSQLIHQRDESNIFIAGIAHDLKIPISIIQLVLEDADNQNISQEPKEKIRRESDKMIEKLSGLLCYLRLGQFEKDYLIERVNLIDEIRNAINAKKDFFILNNIYPRFNSEQAPIYILTDHKWHSILLDQIISNAIKYSAVKGKQGYVEFNINSSDTSIELTVTDFGVGIPSYEMERIFDPFFTGENGRQVGNSSGIGLYLCRTIAQKLGVGLSLKSVRGEKTEVTIRYLSNL